MDGNKPDRVLPVTLNGCECNERKTSTWCKFKSKIQLNQNDCFAIVQNSQDKKNK